MGELKMADNANPLEEFERKVNRELVDIVTGAIWDKKGFDVRAYDVREILDYTDCMVICSGSSDRQANAIADNVIAEVKAQTGERPGSSEGLRDGRWALVDFSDVVVHVFHRPVRDYYELDRLYADAPTLKLTAPEWDKASDPRWATATDWVEPTADDPDSQGAHASGGDFAPEDYASDSYDEAAYDDEAAEDNGADASADEEAEASTAPDRADG